MERSSATQLLGTTVDTTMGTVTRTAIGTMTGTGDKVMDKTAAQADLIARLAETFVHMATPLRPIARPATGNGIGHRSATTIVATAEWSTTRGLCGAGAT